MNTLPIHEVLIVYSHSTGKRRKRNRRTYQKSICVRAPDSNASISRASRLFIKLHPNTRIISIVDSIVYPPETTRTPISEIIITPHTCSTLRFHALYDHFAKSLNRLIR